MLSIAGFPSKQPNTTNHLLVDYSCDSYCIWVDLSFFLGVHDLHIM